MKNGTESMNTIESIIEQFNCVYAPALAAQTARQAIDKNFIVMDPKKLPKVSVGFGGMLVSGETTVMDTQMTASHALRRAREWMAIAEKIEHLGKEKANRERDLAKKRDVVYKRLFPGATVGSGYASCLTAVQTVIDEVVKLEEELDSAKKYR